MNYHAANRRFVARLMFRLMGEPMISTWSAEEMAAELRAAGFVVAEETGLADWNARFARGMAMVGRASYMRIAVATKS